MPLYRAVIAPEGPLASPLHSDTLFGAFCWSWLRLFGRGSLEGEIVAPSLAGEPPVIFSNGFPHGGLPLPLGVYDRADRFEDIADKRARRTAYQRNKKRKGAKYLAREAFLRVCSGDQRGFTGSLMEEIGQDETTVHNMVARRSGTVGSLDGAGDLFGAERRFFRPEDRFDLYALTALSQERFRQTLELMLALGIGADKSAGCGVFRLELLEEDAALQAPPEGANAFTALSNFIPARHDPVDGWYRTFPKYPKLDREFAAGETPFKKPLLFLKAGALFPTGGAPALWYGRCIGGAAAVDAPVTVNACTIAVPVRLPPDAV